MKYKLKDLVTIKYGKNQKKVEDNLNGKIPILGTGGIIGYSKEFLYDKPSVLIGRKGTIDKIKFVDYPFWTIDTLFYTEINEKLILPQYLYYKLLGINFNNLNEGTTIPSLRTQTLYEIELDVDEMDIQRKVVKLLSLIDKKIKQNTRTNNNLYELSRIIFKKLYRKSENWKECKIQDIELYITDYVANGSFKSLADNVKIYDTKDYALFVRNTDLKVNFSQERKYVDEHSYNFLSKSKLFGRELIISNVGDVGSIYLCPSYKMPMTLGNNVIMIDSKGLKVNYNYYLYYFFLSTEGQYLIDGITGGSAQPKFNKTDFRNSIIKIPSDDEIIEFNKKIIPLYDIIEKNIMENETLSILRDTLLPKLMKSKIDLDKIEI